MLSPSDKVGQLPARIEFDASNHAFGTRCSSDSVAATTGRDGNASERTAHAGQAGGTT
jgi:hypothetical protein